MSEVTLYIIRCEWCMIHMQASSIHGYTVRDALFPNATHNDRAWRTPICFAQASDLCSGVSL